MEAKPIKRPPWRPKTIAHKTLVRLRHMMAAEGYEPLNPDSTAADDLMERIIKIIEEAPRPIDKSGT